MLFPPFFCFAAVSIHALLAESDAGPCTPGQHRGVSIHALLAESDLIPAMGRLMGHLFLSTLSLRRATCKHLSSDFRRGCFYPRSPCGERLSALYDILELFSVSIHALLAESDASLT